jgi:hypothetical protein
MRTHVEQRPASDRGCQRNGYPRPLLLQLPWRTGHESRKSLAEVPERYICTSRNQTHIQVLISGSLSPPVLDGYTRWNLWFKDLIPACQHQKALPILPSHVVLYVRLVPRFDRLQALNHTAKRGKAGDSPVDRVAELPQIARAEVRVRLDLLIRYQERPHSRSGI